MYYPPVLVSYATPAAKRPARFSFFKRVSQGVYNLERIYYPRLGFLRWAAKRPARFSFFEMMRARRPRSQGCDEGWSACITFPWAAKRPARFFL